MKKITTLLLTILLLCNSSLTLNTIRADETGEPVNESEVITEDENEASEEEITIEEASEEEEPERETVDIVSLLEDLPDIEEIDEENHSLIYEQYISLKEIIDTLSEEEKSTLDFTKYEALEAYFNNENTETEVELPEEEPAETFQEPEETEEETHILNYIDDGIDTELLLHEDEIELNGDTLPSSYDLRNYNQVTAVRNQGRYGTCWAHAVVASAESTYLKKTGTALNLSELHLAWYGYNSYNKNDPQSLVYSDGAKCAGNNNALNVGGNSILSTFILSSGIGLNNESDYPYSTASSYMDTNYNASNCYDADYYLENARWISMSEPDYVKKTIMDYGAVVASFYYRLYNHNENLHTYYTNETTRTNHAIAIVGWDDNYSKTNFNNTPAGNGAWLVKNSWGTGGNDDGYLWISYYDTSISNSAAFSFSIEENNSSTYIYQYDGGINQSYFQGPANTLYEGNVYTAKRSEYLKKVGFYNVNANTVYRVKIYKDLPTDSNGRATSPEGETLCVTTSGVAEYSGYITVDLESYVSLTEGEKYSIVIERDFDGYYQTLVDTEAAASSPIQFYAHADAKQSFYKTDCTGWSDYYNCQMTARIKGFTDTSLYFTCTTPVVNLEVGGTTSLTFTSNLNSTDYTYTSSDESIATASGNTITAIGSGTATITAYCKGLSTEIIVTVGTPSPAPDFTISIDDGGWVTLECDDSDYLYNIIYSSDALKVVFSDGNVTDEFSSNQFNVGTTIPGYTRLLSRWLYFDGLQLRDNTTYTSLELNVEGYATVNKTISLTTKKVAPELTFENTATGIVITGDSDYLNTIQSITIEGTTQNLFNSSYLQDGVITIPAAVLTGYGIECDTYYFVVTSSAYYLYDKEFAYTVNATPLPSITFAKNQAETDYILTADEDYIDGLFEAYSRGSRIKLRYRDLCYAIPSSAFTRTNETTVTINIASVNATLPGVDGRTYQICLYSQGYAPYTENYHETTNLTPKIGDIFYLTYHLQSGDIKRIVYRYATSYFPDVEQVEYKHFSCFKDQNGTCYYGEINTDNLTEDLELTPVYLYNFKVDDITSSISGSYVMSGARIYLSSDEDATIYYTLDGSEPTSESYEYNNSILIDENIATDNVVTIKAVAMEENCEDSDIATFVYTINDDAADWGTIESQDRYEFADAREVPKGYWARGIEDIYYTEGVSKFVQENYRVYSHKKLLREKIDYNVSYSNNTKVGTAKIIFTFKGNYSGKLEYTYEINPIDICWYSVELTNDVFAYTGKKVIPSLKVIDMGSGNVIKSSNYDIEFFYDDDGKSVGEHTLIVVGKGNYTGAATATYTITKKTLISKVKIIGIENYVWDGEEHKPELTLTYGKKTLVLNQDYTLEYDELTAYVGKHTVTITGIGDYAGTVKKTYEVTGRSASKFVITNLQDTYELGTALYPHVVYKDGEIEIDLVNGVDYTSDCSGTSQAGTNTITIMGETYAGYTGSKTFTYHVAGTDISKYSLESSLDSIYTGEAIIPSVVLVKKNTTERIERGALLSEYELMSYVDKKNCDFTLELKNNVNKGKATVVIRGVNSYYGTITKTFNINAKNLSNLEFEIIEPQNYVKGGVKPEVIIMDGEYELELNKDFTVKYSNNTTVGGSKQPKVTVTGKGNYTGTVSQNFTIRNSDISCLTLNVKDKAYTNKKGNYVQSVSVKDIDGKTLKVNTDYNSKVIYTYVNKTVLANGTVREANEIVSSNDVVPAGTEIRASVTGKGNYVGTLSKTYRIVSTDISKAKVTILSQYYRGSEIELDKGQISIKAGNDLLTDKDYKIVSYSKNNQVGTASVVLEGIGDYGGTKTATFKILSRPSGTIIVLNANGGTGSMKNVDADSSATNLPTNAYKRKGFTFIGWNTRTDGLGTAFDNRESISEIEMNVGDTLVLYAIWQKDTYTITLNPNEGNLPSGYEETISYTVEDAVTLPVPTRANYTFAGWYNGKTKVTSIKKGTVNDITLTAKWTEGTNYTIVYDKNDSSATGKMSNTKVTAGKNVTLTSFAYKLSNKVFVEWNTESDGTGISYKNKATILKSNPLSTYGNESITLYAVWDDVKNFTIQFNSNDGTGTMKNQSMSNKSYKALTANTFKRAGYTFTGWNTAPDGKGISYKNKETFSAYRGERNGNVTLYAQWSLNTYSITYKNMKSTDTNPNPVSYTVLDEEDIELVIPTRNNYLCLGWYSDSSYKKKVETIRISELKNKTLYAKWVVAAEIMDVDAYSSYIPSGSTYSQTKASIKNYLSKFKNLTIQSVTADDPSDVGRIESITVNGVVNEYTGGLYPTSTTRIIVKIYK